MSDISIEIVNIESFDGISEYEIKIEEEFVVSGKDYDKFKEKLEELISEYRI